MDSKLEEKLSQAKDSFIKTYLQGLPTTVKYAVSKSDGAREDDIARDLLVFKFNGLVGNKVSIFKDRFIDHLDVMERFLAFSSSPKAFEKAWRFRKTKISSLSLFEVQGLLTNHAQLIPTISSENILNSNQKGMIKSRENKSFLYGVRHSKGTYDDTLDELGNFSYQPPFDPLGMLRYRWLEHLSVVFDLPLYMFTTMWFKHEVLDATNHVTMLCPVKITKANDRFDSPLNLQIITVDESIERTMMIRSMDTLDMNTEIRKGLPEEYVIKFNYESLKSNPKLRNSLIDWAIRKGKKCPGDKCQNVEFGKLKSRSKIHLGHIVPQNWGGVFQFLQEKNHIHHPDNLYLSCSVCNIALNASFPGDLLKKNIVNSNFGTVGDFIRSDHNYFSKANE